jgi:outer membrane protein
MKTASIFTKISLVLLIAGSITACKQKTDGTTAATTSAPAQNKETIVYVNSDTLLSKYNYAKDIGQKVADKGKSAQSDLQSKGEAFQREYAEYQKNAATLPADQRQTTEQRLQREQQQLQSYQQNASAEFQDYKASQDTKLFVKVTDFVKTYAKQKGYKLVLTYSKASPTILYGDPTLDITTDVVKGLNDAYTKESSK